MSLTLCDFFDTDRYEHQKLFEACQYAWEPLKKIEGYLNAFSGWQILGKISPHAILENESLIYIAPGVIVEPFCYIQGPCIIGEGSVIRHGAYIRGNVIVGKGCVIGHTTEVKNSLFLDKAQAAHFAYVGDSILGNNVNLGAGTKLANLRFDHKEIVVHYMGEKIPTGLKKFGAVCGDFSQTGCNTVTNPGTLMKKRAACAPCMNPTGVVEEGLVLRAPFSTLSQETPFP